MINWIENKIFMNMDLKQMNLLFNLHYMELEDKMDKILEDYVSCLQSIELILDTAQELDYGLRIKEQQIHNKYIENKCKFENLLTEYLQNTFHNGICLSCNLRICINNGIEESEKSVICNGSDPQIFSKNQFVSFKKELKIMD